MKNVVLHNIINVHLNYKYAFNCMLLNVLTWAYVFAPGARVFSCIHRTANSSIGITIPIVYHSDPPKPTCISNSEI